MTMMAEARKTAPVVDPSCWWVVLELHPDATAGQVKQAYREKMKECHPDRVAGLAPQIQELANEMAQRLTAALDQYSLRPQHSLILAGKRGDRALRSPMSNTLFIIMGRGHARPLVGSTPDRTSVRSRIRDTRRCRRLRRNVSQRSGV
jgi:DnaJ domain